MRIKLFLLLVFTLALATVPCGKTNALTLVEYNALLLPQPPSPEEMAKRETEWMKTELALTPEQLTSVSAINLKYANKMSEIFQQSQGNMDSVREKMKELRAQKEDEFAKVLTPEQLKKYQESAAKHRPRPGGQKND